METKARIVNITNKGSECILAFSVPFTDDLRAFYDKAKDYKAIRLKAVKWADNRSLDANRYAWVLMTKLAIAYDTTKEEIYEQKLEDYAHAYGDTWVYDQNGKPVVITMINEVDKTSLPGHWIKIKHGEKYSAYMQIKGSSEFDSIQMSHFIKLIQEDCRGQNIEVLTPQELERLLAEWQSIRKA